MLSGRHSRTAQTLLILPLLCNGTVLRTSLIWSLLLGCDGQHRGLCTVQCASAAWKAIKKR